MTDIASRMSVTGTIPTFELGDRLRKARLVAGYEMTELAELIGVHRQSVKNYERGTTTPRRPALVAWAMATGCDLDWITTGCTPRDSNSEPTVSGFDTSKSAKTRGSRKLADDAVSQLEAIAARSDVAAEMLRAADMLAAQVDAAPAPKVNATAARRAARAKAGR